MKHLLALIFSVALTVSYCQTTNAPKLGTQTPVEFSGLSTIYNGSLTLIWNTASEKDNDHFDIFRSVDRGLTWQKVGSVPGNGTTKTVSTYTWNEGETLLWEVYYRLVQVDLNGKETELTIIYYDFTDSYWNGIKLNGKILSIRKIQESGSDNLVIIVTDRQVYKIMSSYKD